MRLMKYQGKKTLTKKSDFVNRSAFRKDISIIVRKEWKNLDKRIEQKFKYVFKDRPGD